MSTFSQRDFENASAELLRKTAALSVEEIDRAYEALHAPDAHTSVHKLAETALRTCAAKAQDAPAHLRDAYARTATYAISQRRADITPPVPPVQVCRPERVSTGEMTAPATAIAIEKEIESTSAAVHSVCAEFVRQAEMFEINPNPIPHIHQPHEEMASACQWAAWLFTASGVFVAFLLTATALERPLIGAVAAVAVFLIMEFTVSRTIAAVMPGRTFIADSRAFLFACAGALVLGVATLGLGRFAQGEFAARLVDYSPILWCAIEIPILFLGAYAVVGRRRFSWSGEAVRQLRALQEHLTVLRERVEYRRQQAQGEPGLADSFAFSHACDASAGTAGAIHQDDIRSGDPYVKQELTEHERPTRAVAAMQAWRDSCARADRDLRRGYSTSVSRFMQALSGQIQAIHSRAVWSWVMALLTLTVFSFTIITGWRVLINGLRIISGSPGSDLAVLSSREINRGFDIGVNSSSGRTDWLSNDAGVLNMRYPGNHAWGAVFLTVGGPNTKPRQGIDLSSYQSLVLELRGAPGGNIKIGIKDTTQPDDGTEVMFPLQISPHWQTYTVPLTSFAGADLKKIYVVTEFIFTGPQATTVEVRAVRFKASTSSPP